MNGKRSLKPIAEEPTVGEIIIEGPDVADTVDGTVEKSQEILENTFTTEVITSEQGIIVKAKYNDFVYDFNIVFEGNEDEGFIAKANGFPAFLTSGNSKSEEIALNNFYTVLLGALEEYLAIYVQGNKNYNYKANFQKDLIDYLS